MRSSSDRRKVIVEIATEALHLIEEFDGPIMEEGVADLERYNDTELAILRDFLRRWRELQMRHAARIRSQHRAR